MQKEFSSDDGTLIFGIICLTAAMGLLASFIDKTYVIGAMESGNVVGVELPSNFIEISYIFQARVTAALVLTWTSIVCVKFSYLLLFRRLINRLPHMLFWWVAVVYNAASSAYGAAVYGLACPYYHTVKARKQWNHPSRQSVELIISSAMCFWGWSTQRSGIFAKPDDFGHLWGHIKYVCKK